MSNQVALTAVIKAKDEASKVFTSVGGSTNKLMSVFGGLATAAAGAGIAVATASVKMAADFEKSMSNVSTLIDTGTESMEEMGNQVLDISKRVPVSLNNLSTALYDVRSAGISASDAMMVLEKSAMLGVSGLGTTQEAVNLATSAINAFGFEGEEAAKVFDTVQLTVKSGKTTISELAQSFGMVAGVANTAGVSFDELMAATAALTTTGQKASVAQTQLRAAILSIQAPTKDMSDLISNLGYQSGAAMLKELGLVESMNAIDRAAGGNVETLKKAYGSVEGLGSALSLTGEQGQAFIDTLNGIVTGSGAADEAYGKATDNLVSKTELLKNKVNASMVEVGGKISEELLEHWDEIEIAIEGVTNAVIGLSKAIMWVIGNWEGFNKWVNDFAEGYGKVLYNMSAIGQAQNLDRLAADLIPGYEGVISGENNPFKKITNDLGKHVGGYYSQESTNKGADFMGNKVIQNPYDTQSRTIINLDLRGATVTDDQIAKQVQDKIMKGVGYSQVAK